MQLGVILTIWYGVLLEFIKECFGMRGQYA